MSSIECIVLDFDGTFTRVDEEAEPFVEAFRKGIAEHLSPERMARWDAAASSIGAAPDRYGWEYEGVIVAPAHADPYIRCTTIGQMLLAEEGVPTGRRTEILQGLYKACYPLSLTVFRHDAKDVVEALVASGVPVYVVSNSATEHVRAKIDSLDPVGKSALQVRGDARKFVMHEPERSHPLFDGLPERMTIPGLERPLMLRRGHYFEVLRKVWEETGAGPETTMVCGDIFELDLAMPARLGSRVHLVARPETPEYERRAARSIPGGSTSQDLSGLLLKLHLPG
ncbi:MAG: HAD family hydrolase [Myxococcota bacterium]|nr:HAD family hydrolase [Myxococcota bacterium]